MTYQIIQPPFTLEFSKMSKNELKAYDKWFRSEIPIRIRELAHAVGESPAFASWQPDFKPESLVPLGEWLAKELETRPRTENEIRDLSKDNPYPIDIPDKTLSNRSYSLAMDTAMYLSQVLLKNNPSLRWNQSLDDKSYADYGQPLLVGPAPLPLNPVRVTLAVAFGIVRGTDTAAGLRELYDIWTDLLIRGKAPPLRGSPTGR